ncbi:MAG: lipoyl synthase, partial [Nanoarchaeota archaeon]|nr:lipoyl synthase [Nanoarchaeota archaeon]
MIGLGETKEEIQKTLRELKLAKVDIITIGQYLQPREDLADVDRYYTPEEFAEFKSYAYDLGFKHVESGPLVRSSYHAEDALH